MLVIEARCTAVGQPPLPLTFSETTFSPDTVLPPPGQAGKLTDPVTEALRTSQLPKGSGMVAVSKARRLSAHLDPADTVVTYTLLLELPAKLLAQKGKRAKGASLTTPELRAYLHIDRCASESPLYVLQQGTLTYDVLGPMLTGRLSATLVRTGAGAEEAAEDKLTIEGELHLDL